MLYKNVKTTLTGRETEKSKSIKYECGTVDRAAQVGVEGDCFSPRQDNRIRYSFQTFLRIRKIKFLSDILRCKRVDLSIYAYYWKRLVKSIEKSSYNCNFSKDRKRECCHPAVRKQLSASLDRSVRLGVETLSFCQVCLSRGFRCSSGLYIVWVPFLCASLPLECSDSRSQLCLSGHSVARPTRQRLSLVSFFFIFYFYLLISIFFSSAVVWVTVRRWSDALQDDGIYNYARFIYIF